MRKSLLTFLGEALDQDPGPAGGGWTPPGARPPVPDGAHGLDLPALAWRCWWSPRSFCPAGAGRSPWNGLASPSPSIATIPYQGRLASASGIPFTGQQSMEFRLYAVPTGGTPAWTEYWTGQFSFCQRWSVQRASGQPYDEPVAGERCPGQYSTLAWNHDRHRHRNDSPGPAGKRGLLDAGAYCPDASIDTIKLVDQSVTNSKLADASVSGPKLIDQSVTTAKLIDFGVSPSKLMTGSCRREYC